MSDAHPIRTHIIGATVAGLLVALILWALGFLGVIWRSLWTAASWAWHQLTAGISLPAWVVLIVVGYAVVVTILLRKRRVAPSRPSDERASNLHEGGPQLPPRKLDRLQVKVMRAMAEGDGDTPTVGDLADDLGTSRLRVEQVVEQLEEMGYLKTIRDVVNGPVIDVTRSGRDYLIAEGLV
jgi:hypothetical protein